MKDQDRSMENFSGLGEEVGARLADRRNELGLTLRDVAASAEVSASHLSEIENGRSQVSLPVLLRLVRSLDLTISQLLPRIGGHRARAGTLTELGIGSHRLSHDELELMVEFVGLGAGDTTDITNPSLDDLLIHVLTGAITVDAAGQTIELGAGDSLDSERVPRCSIASRPGAQILTVIRSER